MAHSTRIPQAQLQDGTSLSGQDLDQAMSELARYTEGPIAQQRGRAAHRLVRTYTPNRAAFSVPPPYLRALNDGIADVQNPHRFHGYLVPDHDPDSAVAAQQQFCLTTRFQVQGAAELTRVSLSLLTDSERLATFLYGVGATRPINTWIDNVVFSVEVQDPYALEPGSARYQVPVIVKRDFRVSGWSLLPPTGVAVVGVETTLPAWPGALGSMPTGIIIEVETPVSIPAAADIIVTAILPAGANQGFGSNLPFNNAETCMTVEWSTPCQ